MKPSSKPTRQELLQLARQLLAAVQSGQLESAVMPPSLLSWAQDQGNRAGLSCTRIAGTDSTTLAPRNLITEAIEATATAITSKDR